MENCAIQCLKLRPLVSDGKDLEIQNTHPEKIFNYVFRIFENVIGRFFRNKILINISKKVKKNEKCLYIINIICNDNYELFLKEFEFFIKNYFNLFNVSFYVELHNFSKLELNNAGISLIK